MMKRVGWIAAAAVVAGLLAAVAQGETITHGGTSINMDFVDSGNVGNAADTTGQPNPRGAVAQVYLIEHNGSLANQVITFNALSEIRLGDADLAPGATASSGLPVTYTSSKPLVATIVAGKIHVTGVGTTTITAKQAGNDNWSAAADAAQSLTVGKGTPVIAWLDPAAITFGVALSATQLNAKATTSAGAIVPGAFTYTCPGPITITSGARLNAGAYTITASFKPANLNQYNSATKTVQLNVNKATQTIRFPVLAAKPYGTADFAPGATASSGLPVTYTSDTHTVATIVTGKIHIIGIGQTTITANQAGNDNWNAAPPVTRQLMVNKVAATVTLSNLSHVYDGQRQPVTVKTMPIGLQVSVKYAGGDDAPADVGTYAVTATVTDVNATGAIAKGALNITKASQKITFAALPAMRVGDANRPLTATATSGLPVSYTSATSAVATVVAGAIDVAGAGTTAITATQAGNANWNAAPAVRQTLTVLTEEQDIRAFYAAMKSRAEMQDEVGFLALFAPGYVHQGQALADTFSEPDFLAGIRTFTFRITRITIIGNDAKVYGSCSITFTDGNPAETWSEPDTANDSPGLGWLRKTPDGWRVMGDQVRARVALTTIHYPTPSDDHYFFRMRTESSLDVTSVSVTGSGIPSTSLAFDPEWVGYTGFAGHFTSANRPPVGTVYTFVVQFADGSQETYRDTVKSWVPTAPGISVTTGGGTAVIRWTNVRAAVPNAKSYGVRISGAGGESDSIWRGSEELPLTQTTITFNADGTATGSLGSGQSYTAVVTIFDRYDNYAFQTYDFTMP